MELASSATVLEGIMPLGLDVGQVQKGRNSFAIDFVVKKSPTIANFLLLNLVKGSVFMGQKLPKNVFWD